MANRARDIQITIRVSPEEREMIRQKMDEMEIRNLSIYARKMLIDGQCVRRDFSELKELSKSMASISRSVNQIARRVNETNSVYKQDMDDLYQAFRHIKAKFSERLIKIVRREPSYLARLERTNDDDSSL